MLMAYRWAHKDTGIKAVKIFYPATVSREILFSSITCFYISPDFSWTPPNK